MVIGVIDVMTGRVFYNQATMSAEGISQISVVFGPCTAGCYPHANMTR